MSETTEREPDRCSYCNAPLPTVVHCANCGNFDPRRTAPEPDAEVVELVALARRAAALWKGGARLVVDGGVFANPGIMQGEGALLDRLADELEARLAPAVTERTQEGTDGEM